MAIPSLPDDFKEFLKLLGSNGIEYLLIDVCYAEKETIQIEEMVVQVISLARLRQNKAASGRAKDIADLENLPE